MAVILHSRMIISISMSQDLSSCNVALTLNYSVEKCGCVAVSEELDLYITRWSDTGLRNRSFHSSTGLFMKPEGGTSQAQRA